MNQKNYILMGIIISIVLFGIIYFSSISGDKYTNESKSRTNSIREPKKSSIPNTYYQELNLDGAYIYNVTDFGGSSQWYNLTPWWQGDSYEGDWEPRIGGQIKINFTDFYDKDPNNWGDIFDNPIPWMDIEIIKNDSGVLVSNFTLTNRSNTEMANNLVLGYNSFQSGFLIPIDNLTNIKKIAIEQANAGYSKGNVFIEETFNFLSINFEDVSGNMMVYMIYDRWTGLLVRAKTRSFGYKIEINSLNFTFNKDLTYNYTVNEFGEPVAWLNLSNNFPANFEGYANTNKSGIIAINFTGDYNKHINDNSVFNNPIPWINIDFIENNSGILFMNFTLFNISNSEAALNLHLGFNNFSSGFIIPTENLTDVIKKAETEGSGLKANGFITIDEKSLTIEFIFIETGGENFSAITYDKRTGLLMWMKSKYGNFLLEMKLVLDFIESNPIQPPELATKTIYIEDEEEKRGEKTLANFTLPFVFLGSAAGISIGLLVWKKDNKMLKNIFVGVFGLICFSSLFVFNYWLTTGVASINETSSESPLEIVEDITLTVDFGNDTTKVWSDFTLTGSKTSVLDALEKYCDVEYDDYGWGVLVTAIDGVEGDWLYEVNSEKPGCGADRYYLRDGDKIKWSLN